VDFAEQQRRPAKHLVAFSIVVVLHLLLGYALVSGLARRVVEVIKAPIETKIIEEVKPPPPPPENLPPPPKFAPPPPSFVPPPEVVVNPPPVQQPTITTTQVAPPPAPVTIAPTQPDAPPAPPSPPRAAAKPAIANVAACAPKSEDYPPAAVRAEATGLTKIRFTIDAQGKLVKSEIIKSAGNSREHKLLDRMVESKLSNCRFTPGIDESGKPTGGTFEAEYLWKLE
jgi:protein TonB